MTETLRSLLVQQRQQFELLRQAARIDRVLFEAIENVILCNEHAYLILDEAERENVPARWVESVAPNSAEFILVATRGAPGRLLTLPSAVIATTRSGGHSAKPECWLDYFEHVSPGPYLELFARRNRLGWDTWGDEALQHVPVAPRSAT